jgi:anti-anti-sigma factor
VISETHLDIQPGDSPGTYILAGELDMATAPNIAEISARRHGAVILDFTNVTFVDSIGIWALVNLVRGMDGGTLVIRHASGNVKRTLELVDLADAPGIVLQE